MKPERQKIENLEKLLEIRDQFIFDNLVKYLDLIKQWSKKMNLVSKKDEKDILARHFVPSFWLYDILRLDKPHSILDVGSGAGLPGIILKILSPETTVTLIESNRKKTLFLKEVAERLQLNVNIINERMESYAMLSDALFDTIVSRAVGSADKIWDLSLPVLKEKGAVYLFKGANSTLELDKLKKKGINCSIIKPESKWIKESQQIEKKIIIKLAIS